MVVDTTNFDDQAEFRGFSLRHLRLTERFRRIAPGEIDYEFTVEDSSTYTKPWTVSLPMTLGTQAFEYACHEGNYGLRNILSGARAGDRTGKSDAPK